MKIETAIGLIEERLREVRVALSFAEKSKTFSEPQWKIQFLGQITAYKSEVKFLEQLKTVLEG
jgi:hypothetical protein